MREGFQNPGSCGGSVLVDEPAEHVAALDAVCGRLRAWVTGVGRVESERSVRPLAVVMGGVRSEYVFEVAAAEDQ